MVFNKKRIEMMKQRYPEGTRICLDRMDNDPRPIPPGSKGTVQFVDDMGTIFANLTMEEVWESFPARTVFTQFSRKKN